MATKGKTGQITALNNKWPAMKHPLANAAAKEGKIGKDSTNKELYDSLVKVIKAAVADFYNTPLNDPRLISIVRTIVSYVDGKVKQILDEDSNIQTILDNTNGDAIRHAVEDAIKSSIECIATNEDQFSELASKKQLDELADKLIDRLSADSIVEDILEAIETSKSKQQHDKVLAEIKSMLESSKATASKAETISTTNINKSSSRSSLSSKFNLSSINTMMQRLMKICNNISTLQSKISKSTGKILSNSNIIKRLIERLHELQRNVQSTTDKGFKNTHDNIQKVNDEVEKANENIKRIQNDNLTKRILGKIGKAVLSPFKFINKFFLAPIVGFVSGVITGLLKSISSVLLAPIKLISKGIAKTIDAVASLTAKSFGAFIMTPAGQYAIGFIAGFVWEMWLKDIWNWIVEKVQTTIESIKKFYEYSKTVFAELKNIYNDYISPTITFMTDGLKKLYEIILNLFSVEFWEGIFDKVFDWIYEFKDNVKKHGFAQTFKSMVVDPLVDKVKEVIDDFTKLFNWVFKEEVEEYNKLQTESMQLAAKSKIDAVNNMTNDELDLLRKNTLTDVKIKNLLQQQQNIEDTLAELDKFNSKSFLNRMKSVYYDDEYSAYDYKQQLHILQEDLRLNLAKLGFESIELLNKYIEDNRQFNESKDYSTSIESNIANTTNNVASNILNIPNNLPFNQEKTKIDSIAEDSIVMKEEYNAYIALDIGDGILNNMNSLENQDANQLLLLNLQRQTPKIDNKTALSNLEDVANEYGIGFNKNVHNYNNTNDLADAISNKLKSYLKDINAMPAAEQREWQQKLMQLIIKMNNAIDNKDASLNNYLFMQQQSDESLWNIDRNI